MRRLVVGLALAASCTAFFASAAAAAPAPTGARLCFAYCAGDQHWYPGVPFHFESGWGNNPSQPPSGIGLWTFSLSVDGITQMGIPLTSVSTSPGGVPMIIHEWLFNFPQGMTGTHVVQGSWYGPCAQMVAQGFAAGPCASPNEIVPYSGNPQPETFIFDLPTS